ncbi:hypothetical protein, partial [Cytobacillus oceanisediminis]|uniref:hypothetical protein n=1 Tax=Cytobacillus oceanisediminis TaxID=665099 RepID=UPI001C92C97F
NGEDVVDKRCWKLSRYLGKWKGIEWRLSMLWVFRMKLWMRENEGFVMELVVVKMDGLVMER